MADHALVTVTARHLIAGLDLALHRHEDLDHFHDAGRKLVAPLQFVDLVDKSLLEALLRVVVLTTDGLDAGHRLLVLQRDIPPLAAGHIAEEFLIDVGSLAQPFGSTGNFLAHQDITQPAINVPIENVQLVVAVLGKTFDLFALNRHGAFVFLDAVLC